MFPRRRWALPMTVGVDVAVSKTESFASLGKTVPYLDPVLKGASNFIKQMSLPSVTFPARNGRLQLHSSKRLDRQGWDCHSFLLIVLCMDSQETGWNALTKASGYCYGCWHTLTLGIYQLCWSLAKTPLQSKFSLWMILSIFFCEGISFCKWIGWHT